MTEESDAPEANADVEAGGGDGASEDAGEEVSNQDGDRSEGAGAGDTFGVGVHVTEAELRFVVHVPSDIDSGWTDPEAFQQLVQDVVWERLDREETLRAVAATTAPGETATLGRVTLRPDGTVVEASVAAPEPTG